MPSRDLPLEKLCEYRSRMPRPADFTEFWDERVREAWSLPLHYECVPAETAGNENVRYYDIWLEGMHASRLHAKFVLPVRKERVPVILQFHGYPGASRGWFEQSSFAGMGMAVLALDFPGQGGEGVYASSPRGTTSADHIVMGVDGEPEGLYYTEMYQNTCLLVRLALALRELDPERIYTNGASQGGAFSLVCAALNAGYIQKCASLYPFLTDYYRAWETDRDSVVYAGLKYYNRWFDPTGQGHEAFFTKLGYIDVLNFVDMITCPVLFGTGLMDEYIAPSGQFDTYSRIRAEKEHIIYPDYGHEEIADFDDRLLAFFSKGRETNARN